MDKEELNTNDDIDVSDDDVVSFLSSEELIRSTTDNFSKPILTDELKELLSQRKSQRNSLLNWLIKITTYSFALLAFLAIIQSLIRIINPYYKIFDGNEFQILAVSVFSEIFGVIYVISKSLWDPYRIHGISLLQSAADSLGLGGTSYFENSSQRLITNLSQILVVGPNNKIIAVCPNKASFEEEKSKKGGTFSNDVSILQVVPDNQLRALSCLRDLLRCSLNANINHALEFSFAVSMIVGQDCEAAKQLEYYFDRKYIAAVTKKVQEIQQQFR